MPVIKSKPNPRSEVFRGNAGVMAGLIAPEETRRVLALALSTALHAPIEEIKCSVFRS